MPEIDPITGERIATPPTAGGSAPQIDPQTGERIAATPVPKPAPPAQAGNLFTSGHPIDTLKANFKEAQAGAQPGDGLFMGALKNFGAGGADAVHSVGHALLHPIDTISSSIQGQANESAKPIGQQLKDEVTSGRFLGMGGETAVNTAKGLFHEPMRTMGGLGASAIMGGAGAEAAPAIAKVPSAIRSAAIGDTDAAALRGLRVPPAGKKVVPMQSSVQNARPFLQGANSMEDLQSRIKPAKNEIYAPVQQALEASGDNPVKGPDGPTTLKALEDERRQLSAMNRGLKTGDPGSLQLAQQKGLSQAEALAREKTVQAHLDPELARYGLDPQAIRKAYGSVAQVGNQVAGRSTLLEKTQPSGFGKMLDIDLKSPKTWLGKPLSGIRDIAAGRPLFSASPSDVGIREGFANAGAKPDMGRFAMPAPPKGLLNAPSIELNSPPEIGGTPAGYRPPPFYRDTTPMRTGRLLNAPPTQLPGAVHPEVQSTFRHDTTPMRFGRILPPPIENGELPSSYHTAAFPEQLPSATRVRPKTIEGKK